MSALDRANAYTMRILSIIQPYMVEVAYFTFFLARHMSLPLFQEYVESEIYKQHHINGTPSQLEETFIESSDQYENAHRETTLTVLSLQIAEGLPAVISVLILGAVSDRTGRRKILLWMPSLGSLVFSLVYIFIMYTGWTLDGLFMASAVRGLSGSMTAFLAGSTYFGVKAVDKSKISSRLALQEFLNGAAYAIANLMVGYWVKDHGFLQPFWFMFILSAIALLISVFLVVEVKVDNNITVNNNRYNSENCCIDTFRPMARFFKCCSDRKLIKVWLAILAFQTYAIVHIGQLNTLVLYLSGPPYAWPSTEIGLYLCVMMLVAAIGTFVVPPVLRRHFSDTTITFAGFCSKAVGTLWIAVIKNETVLYFAILLLVLELLPFPMLRSIVSKGIQTEDQGSLFALMHCGESVTYFLAPLLFQAIYADTFRQFSGTVFVISCICLFAPVLLVVGIRYLEMNQPMEYQPMEGESEMATANDTTTTVTQQEEQQPISVIQVNTERV
ncbi:hypothetical protein KUTeg_014272 [Tegillarca granosa]|uniref:Solute carrier family 46 member 3 n=1 Tax=Tegillarca granosa TaxID=220873 RepID=A0ABQ9EW59_TEGGR|nr:hypothetical protein KUTeg_014272 [Tegillarca granosa]